MWTFHITWLLCKFVSKYKFFRYFKVNCMSSKCNLCRIYSFYVQVIWLHRLQKSSSVTNNVVGKSRHSKIEVLLVLGISSRHSASPHSRTPQQQIQLIIEKENTPTNLIRMTGCIWIKDVSTCNSIREATCVTLMKRGSNKTFDHQVEMYSRT